ncbi:hypothetical protein Vadar_014668 [Vaccinium darrowii]|uniref:Uncharacterized protein n=1 Tax=Vaccinium darrowii TaxID=229202 RepID=A0ACB7Y6N5_9ERIC|nr:hypothetical protein Vadar_014668 [Vaccinium darrowii]
MPINIPSIFSFAKTHSLQQFSFMRLAMELFYASLLSLFLLLVFLSLHFLIPSTPKKLKNLPPSQTGLPIIGETIQYLAAGWKGHSEKFIFDRISNYPSTRPTLTKLTSCANQPWSSVVPRPTSSYSPTRISLSSRGG